MIPSKELSGGGIVLRKVRKQRAYFGLCSADDLLVGQFHERTRSGC